jgi:hypothetical protein
LSLKTLALLIFVGTCLIAPALTTGPWAPWRQERLCSFLQKHPEGRKLERKAGNRHIKIQHSHK